ncbi:Probable transposable element [Penicillium roqueforti FM164]|uniref:Probable transposable element n=2 Tax=Penicillium roqueforti (strain FM164) TaxID=1365484 RepID=W6QPX2_PENRF|nr:Probable transposable element [Penicillium roqueforti FM164]
MSSQPVNPPMLQDHDALRKMFEEKADSILEWLESKSQVSYDYDTLREIGVLLHHMDSESEWPRTYLVQPPTMPPIRSQSSKDSIEQEGRILLAIQAFKKQEFTNISIAARTFNVPRSTLRRRLDGIQCRATSRANSTKLTTIEEESLQKWILSMDSRGSAPRPSMV